MKGPLLRDLMREKITIIGRVRRDTALYLPPPPVTEKRRGRPRKYEERIPFERFKECCPLMEQKIVAYGEVQLSQRTEKPFRFAQCLAADAPNAGAMERHDLSFLWTAPSFVSGHGIGESNAVSFHFG